MKFLKSILIFLFFSSILGAFSYAFYRTDGNVYKSIQFTLYFLAIKIGLIGPNVSLKLDYHQPNQQLVSRVGYNPYVSILDKDRPSGLLMDSIERSSLVPQYSYSQDAINQLRAGDSRVREAAWLLITIWMLQQQSVGFQPVRQAPPPPHRQLFGGTSSSPRNNYFSKSSQPGTSLQVQKPSNMPQQNFSGLTPQQKRDLPDARDGFIREKGHPHLGVGYNQVKFKTPDHGSAHRLPVNEKGRTPKTEKNALILRDSILNMPNRKNIIWFDNGMYQGGTIRGYDSVNLYDPDTEVIAVFKKRSNGQYSRFATTCKLTDMERDFFLSSGGNFVTEPNLKDPKVLHIIKNLTNTEKNNDF
jgi:hypothetical protein